MATTEALEFLSWMQRNAYQDQCLEKGVDWPQWATSEGFDPDAILDGLR